MKQIKKLTRLGLITKISSLVKRKFIEFRLVLIFLYPDKELFDLSEG